jgi:large subunit ribosomal protein L29
MVTIQELKNLDVSELEQKVQTLKRELFNLKFSKLTGQLKDTSQFSKLRTAVAKTLTVLKSKKQ